MIMLKAQSPSLLTTPFGLMITSSLMIKAIPKLRMINMLIK